MSQLQVIKLTEQDKWDHIVKSFHDYDVSYLSDYAKAFCLKGDGEPQLIYVEDGDTRAINVIMKRDIADSDIFKDKIPLNTHFDIVSPYGYGGFWLEGGNYQGVLNEYEDYCQEQGFVCEFVRFHLLSDYKEHFRGTVEAHTHNIIRPLQMTLDEIMADFEHKVRKNLKRAKLSGLEIEIDTTGEKLDDFLKIYYSTMERTGATKDFYFDKEIFETFNQMQGNFAYFNVLSEGITISTELVVYGSENCYSFLGGTLQNYFNLRPNEFLKVEIIKWAKNMGLKNFILGGGYGSDDGIFHYKKSLSPNGVYSFYTGKKILDREKYRQLTEIRMAASETGLDEGFFPLYRAAAKEALSTKQEETV